MRLLLIVISSLLVSLSCDNGNPVDDDGPETGTMTDIEGNVYKTVKIGNQWWMAENLRTTRYNDDTEIPHIPEGAVWDTLSTPGYCHYNNTTDSDSMVKFGALYNWYAAEAGKLAPEGWHVPDTTEWNTLRDYLIDNGYNWDGTTEGNKIGKAMAAKTDWESSNGEGDVGNDMSTNNSSGFSGLPGGRRGDDGIFVYQGSTGYWWSATEYDASNARFYRLDYLTSYLTAAYFIKDNGCSIRLVKD